MIAPLEQRSTQVLEKEIKSLEKIIQDLDLLLTDNTPAVSSAKQTILDAIDAREKELAKRHQI